MKKEIINLKGKDYPTYSYVLDKAHSAGLVKIKTKLIQIPSRDNNDTAIVKAFVFLKKKIKKQELEKTYEAYGDASPDNTTTQIATALIRMAETRAKGRAMRDAVNIGETMLEELPEPKTERKTASGEEFFCEDCGQKITDKVANFSQNNYEKKLCLDCQKKAKRPN